MNEWYYAKGGQQYGPVALQEIQELLRNGGLDPNKDLVWASHMKDWKPANEVDELNRHDPQASLRGLVQASAVVNVPSGANATQGGGEIEPGSDPILMGECITRGFELTKARFGEILLVGLAYFGILMGLSFITTMVEGGVQMVFPNEGNKPANEYGIPAMAAPVMAVMAITYLFTQVAAIFLNLGLTRFALNLVSGRPVEVGQLFGEGGKLLRAIGASILFFLMVLVGIVMFVVPGVYLALRYGQYMTAIVDKDMGVFESFSYSAQITKNNMWQLLGLGILCGLIATAGALACCVGMIFTGPVAWLAWVVGYRWMQYGRAAVQQPA